MTDLAEPTTQQWQLERQLGRDHAEIARLAQKDISDLQDRDVAWAEGTITRKRSKTASHEGVPTVTYRLWPETLQLLQEHRSGTDVVLLTRAGKRLVQVPVRNTQSEC